MKSFTPDELVHFHGYNPTSALVGFSPLETLRRVLAEEHAMGEYRENFWKNSARIGGIIERPKDAPAWSDSARQRFKQEFEALYTGGSNSGRTAVLEEGMSWKAGSFTAEESEYLEGRKLTREECARAFHIPPPLVGILDHATFSNIREQHKSLYTDTLGPIMAGIEDDIEIQLLPDLDDSEGVYVEFNIQEKLQGDFQEQASILQTAVGRPYMTANEARARLNLPRLEGADELVTPLNVLIGGQASPTDSAPPPKAVEISFKERPLVARLPEKFDHYVEEWSKLLTRTLTRQQASVLSNVKMMPEIGALWDGERWNTECKNDFYLLGYETLMEWASYMAKLLSFQPDEQGFKDWCASNAGIFAEKFNQATMNDLSQALKDENPREAIGRLFETALAVRVGMLALSRVTSLSNYGAMKTARDGGVRWKTWVVSSDHPRDTHLKLDGETVGINQLFSNGLRYPGDPLGSSDETCNCRCFLQYRM